MSSAHIIAASKNSAEAHIDVNVSARVDDPNEITATIAAKLKIFVPEHLARASTYERNRVAKLIVAAIHNARIVIVHNAVMTSTNGLIRHVSDIDLQLARQERIVLGSDDVAIIAGRDLKQSVAKIPCMSELAFESFQTFQQQLERDIAEEKVASENRAREQASRDRETSARAPLLYRRSPPLYDVFEIFSPPNPKRALVGTVLVAILFLLSSIVAVATVIVARADGWISSATCFGDRSTNKTCAVLLSLAGVSAVALVCTIGWTAYFIAFRKSLRMAAMACAFVVGLLLAFVAAGLAATIAVDTAAATEQEHNVFVLSIVTAVLWFMTGCCGIPFAACSCSA